jgi:hypothetical protein
VSVRGAHLIGACLAALAAVCYWLMTENGAPSGARSHGDACEIGGHPTSSPAGRIELGSSVALFRRS